MKTKLSVFLFLFLIFLLYFHPINSGDFFHHLKTGEYIVTNLKLPQTDEWSFTAKGIPWVAHSWGAGVLFWIVWKIGETAGTDGAVAVNIFFALSGCLGAYLFYRVLLKISGKTDLSLLLVLWGMTVTAGRSLSKPESPVLPFLAGLLYFLVFRPRFMAVLLAAWFYLWGIMYGPSAILGLGILGMFLVLGELGLPSPDLKSGFGEVKRRGRLFVVCTAAALLNGYGFRSLFYGINIPGMSKYVGEWLPMWSAMNPRIPDLVLLNQWPVLFYLIFITVITIIIIIIVIKHISKPQVILVSPAQGGAHPGSRPDSGRISPGTVWYLASFARMTIFFFLLAIFAYLPIISFRTLAFAPVLGLPLLAFFLKDRKGRLFAILTALLITSSAGAFYLRLKEIRFDGGISDEIFPVSAVNFLEHKGISGKIFAPQEWGAYLYWNLPGTKVFIDTRDELYLPLDLFGRLEKLDRGEVDILELLDEYNADLVVANIVNGEIYRPLFQNSQWGVYFLDGGVFVAGRKSDPQLAGLPVFTSVYPFADPPASGQNLKTAEKELREMTDLKNPENSIRLVQVYLAESKTAEAINFLEEVIYPDGILRSARNDGIETGSKKKMNLNSRINFELTKLRAYLEADHCGDAEKALQMVEGLNKGKLIFFPEVRMTGSGDEVTGDYYRKCTNDTNKAREFYLSALNGIISREKKERLLGKIEGLNK